MSAHCRTHDIDYPGDGRDEVEQIHADYRMCGFSIHELYRNGERIPRPGEAGLQGSLKFKIAWVRMQHVKLFQF